MLEKARIFAIQSHGEQQYGSKPYLVHLDAVVQNLEDYGETAKIVGYLHDVVEDTGITYEDIKAKFGEFIANCVSIVTDEDGANRQERKKKTYDKMSKVTGDLELALIVKTADRLANIQACIEDENTRLLEVYKNEHPTFKSAAYRNNLCESMWKKIDDLLSPNQPPL